MLYYLCSRCQFKVQANKHICPTCGYKMPTQSGDQAHDEKENKAGRANIWLKMLGIDSAGKKETGHDKPALAE